MAETLAVPCLKRHKVISRENRRWIAFEEFYKHLCECKIDKSAIPRKDSIKRTFTKGNNFLVVGEVSFIPLNNVIHFCYDQRKSLCLPNTVASQIEEMCVNNIDNVTEPVVSSSSKQGNKKSTADLYDRIVKELFTFETLEDLLQKQDLILQNSESLQTNFKDNFTTKNWEKIKRFELHFVKQRQNYSKWNATTVLDEKYKYFNTLKQLNDKQKEFSESCSNVIKTETLRQSVAESQNGDVIQGTHQHLPKALHSDVSHEQYNTCIVGCQQGKCGHNKRLHIFISLTTENYEDEELQLYARYVNALMINTHGDVCQEITFFKRGSFNDYIQNEAINSFQLSDAIFLGKLQDNKITSSSAHFDLDVDTSLNLCPSCSKTLADNNTVDSKTLDLIYEWVYNVPLPFQIILLSFVNRDYMKRIKHCGNLDYLRKRISKLYNVFHMLLNIHCRKYSSILKSLMTDELAFSYHNASTVFGITSEGGLAYGLRQSENMLKKQNDSDVLYYQNFLKEHEITYTTNAGPVTKNMRFSDCHLIFFLDNLVRLTFGSNPKREENRSSQICTLPVTLKGLPADSSVTDQWHNQEMCDGTDNCPCKQPIPLQPSDVDRVLLNHTPEEAAAIKKFRTNSFFGLSGIWHMVRPHLLEELPQQSMMQPGKIGI